MQYGPIIKNGKSNVIIVAPHAYLPEWNLDLKKFSDADYYKKFGDIDVTVLIPGLIISTGSSGLFNTVIPRKKADFNKLIRKTKAHLAFQKFLQDLELLIYNARSLNPDKPVFVLAIHSFPKNYCKDITLLFKDGGQDNRGRAGQSRKYQIDLGCGLLENTNIPYPSEFPKDLDSFLEEKLLAVTQYNARYGSGNVICSRETIFRVKKILAESYVVTIGREWSANRENNLLQYLFKEYQVYGIQIEIVNGLIKSPGLLINLKQVIRFLQTVTI